MISKVLTSFFLLSTLGESCLAWTSNNPGNERCNQRTTVSSIQGTTKPVDNVPVSTRRSIIAAIPALSTFLVSKTALARDELFKPNPLTNSVLEQIRILEQAEADNLKYGGELEAGDAGNKGKVSAYPSLLVPILKIEQDLAKVKSLVYEKTPSAWKEAVAILQTDRFDKLTFKKTFNKYGDNIYYSDPDRANLYLGGGATPKTEQSMAYLLRNDILTNMENLRAELGYLLKSGDPEIDDLFKYTNIVNDAMAKYLTIVPPSELEEARRILSSQ